MNTKGSVTQWLEAVELGDDLAAQRLWERYYGGLLRLARGKLVGMAGRAFGIGAGFQHPVRHQALEPGLRRFGRS